MPPRARTARPSRQLVVDEHTLALRPRGAPDGVAGVCPFSLSSPSTVAGAAVVRTLPHVTQHAATHDMPDSVLRGAHAVHISCGNHTLSAGVTGHSRAHGGDDGAGVCWRAGERERSREQLLEGCSPSLGGSDAQH